MNDKVSIALATYNGEKYLLKLLASLEAQTLRPQELVVVDDCSSDRTLDIIREFPLSFEKKIYSNETNIGPNANFKKLAGLCSGEYIAFCDQDDIWLPGKVASCLTALKKLPADAPAIVFSDLSVIDEAGKVIHDSFWKLRSTKPGNFSLKDILFGNIVTGCASLINREMGKAVTKMPVHIMMYDHWMALIGFSFGKHAFIDESLLLYRAHGFNVTDKHKASFAKNFINELKHKPAYLQKNIQQAIEFKKLYATKLNTSDLKVLNNFVDLEKRSFFYKRFSRDKTSLIRRLKF